ncbi:MAG TPA: hypothetical protein PLH25_02985 [Flavobacterium sp.]|nr:hypothetical protein [Flavobacterium sp.]HQW68604.1 hypothetical protein [Flavobacterium sp.]
MKKLFFFLLLLFSTQVSFSQMNRQVGRGNPQVNVPRNNEKIDPIKSSLDYLKKELTLDTFQEAAIKTFLEENQKETELILSMDIANVDKGEKLKTSYEKMEKQIEKFLNPKQIDLFKKLKEKQSGSKKKKNKKEKKEETPIEN